MPMFMDYHNDDGLISFKTETKSHNKLNAKRKFIGVLGIVAVMYLAFTTLRSSGLASSFKRILSVPCAGSATRHHANFSTGQGLPSHYTLPSGDKIPSVALGTVSFGFRGVTR